MEVYAHRGLLDESGGGALENTPLALQRAVKAGFSVETDFRYGVGHDILIFHDNTLERLLDDTRSIETVGADQLCGLYEKRTGLDEPDLPRLENLLAWDCWSGGRCLLVNIKQPDDQEFILEVCSQIVRSGRELSTYLFDMRNDLIPSVKAAFPDVRLLARLSHLEGEHSEDVADLRAFSAGVWFDDYHGTLLGSAVEQRVSRLDLPLFYVSPELHRDTHPLGNGKQQEGWHQILGNPRFVGICTDFPHEARWFFAAASSEMT